MTTVLTFHHVGTDFTLTINGDNEPGFSKISSLADLVIALQEPSRLKLGKELSDGAIDAFKRTDPDRSKYASQIRTNINKKLRELGIHPRRKILYLGDVKVIVTEE